MKNHYKQLYACLLGISALAAGALPATAATSLGTASGFAVLSAAPGGGGAVACTNSTVVGVIGSTGTVAPVSCTASDIQGGVVANFDAAYDALANISCDRVLTTLDGEILGPGVYCFGAAATSTGGILTLKGPPTGTWLFKVGTSGTGALTGTNFRVVLDGATACNVTWWVAEGATMTNSDFNGAILAGAAIEATDSTFEGLALAKAAVALTRVTLVGCQGGSVGGGGKTKEACNQGVGNGPESCDPGNSNQGAYPFRSNDEMRSPGEMGTPGNPGRKGGNK